MTRILPAFLLVLLLFAPASYVMAQQDDTGSDTDQILSIPGVTDIFGTPAHLYVLSDSEGMAVFRVQNDSLGWLYTSSGMQRRGSVLQGDIRFAYLYGNGSRLSVLEPTSVLGVFSSTQLENEPSGVARLGNHLYMAMGMAGLGRLSLENPETVDSEPEIVFNDYLKRDPVLDVISSAGSSQLFVLTAESNMYIFTEAEEQVTLTNDITLQVPVTNLFMDEDQIWGSTESNDIYLIFGDGSTRHLGTVDGPVTDILTSDGLTLIRTQNGSLWSADDRKKLALYRAAGGQLQIAKAGGSIWMHSHGRISRLTNLSPTKPASPAPSISTIPDKIITFPDPLLLDLTLENGDYGSTLFSYRSSVTNAQIRDRGFFWQPTVNQMGFHWFTVIAHTPEGSTDSTRFSVEVRSFNSPPRFSPIRPTSIAVNEPYELSVTATDPESQGPQLIRYIGVDMPDGASIDEKTGLFQWTPQPKQVGSHTFKVIASDKKGAAASQDITIRVLDISRGGEN